MPAKKKGEERPVELKTEKRSYLFTLTDRLLASAPADPDKFERYIISKSLSDDQREEREFLHLMNELEEEDRSPSDEYKTCFWRDPDGVYIRNYHLKGFLKEMGNRFKEALGIRALRSKIAHFVYVEPKYIWLKEHPDGVMKYAFPVIGRQGPRMCITMVEYIEEGTQFRADIVLYENKDVSFDVVECLLAQGSRWGLGRRRGDGFGTFTYEHIA